MRPGHGLKLPMTTDPPELEFKIAHDHRPPWTWTQTVCDNSPYFVGYHQTMSLESSSQGEGIVTTAGPHPTLSSIPLSPLALSPSP